MSDMAWQPVETIPMDGTEILIKTHIGVVSAYFCIEEPDNDARDNGVYDWICYDDKFQLDGFQLDGESSVIIGWMPIPE